jgi:hypothetical protein
LKGLGAAHAYDGDKPEMEKYMRRLYPVLLVSLLLAGCSLVGGIFKAGLLGGIVMVVLVLAIVFWLFGKARGR